MSKAESTGAPAIDDHELKIGTFIDLATSRKTRADFTVAATCGLDKLQNFYILDILRGRWEWPIAKERLTREILHQGVKLAGVETNGFQLSAFQELVTDPRLKKVAFFPVPVSEDMTSRSLLVSSKGASDKMYYAAGIGWFEDLVYEFVNFPGRHDDIVSAVTGCLELLNNFEVKIKPRRARYATKRSHWREREY